MKNGFIETTVIDNSKVSGDIFLLKIECPVDFFDNAWAGQFYVFKPLHPGSEMPRPFSVFLNIGEQVWFLIEKRGPNTEAYFKLKKGDKISVMGPLGKETRVFRTKKYIFVAGGIGISGLYNFYRSLSYLNKEKNAKVLWGIKNKNCDLEKFITEMHGKIDVKVAIEREGKLATDLLRKALKKDNGKSIVIACGPKPMLKAVAKITKKYGNKCFVAMEEIMSCGGIGACYSCVVPMKKGLPKRLCQEGLVFDASKIDFDKIKDANPARSPIKVSKKTNKPLRVVLRGRSGRSLVLDAPIMYASGCVDIVSLLEKKTDFSKVGAIVAKGIELKPRHGNPTPRACEVHGGMLNAIGLQGPGIKKFIYSVLPALLALGKPVVANISGGTISEYAVLAQKLSKTKVSAIEINISCPNIKVGGMLFGQNGLDAYEVVREVRKAAPKKFIIVKLTPNVTDIVEIAKCVAQDDGADAISLINTVLGMAIDIRARRPKLANIMGGLSGPIIKPIGIRMVYQVAKAVNIPIIGMGGITRWEDAAEYIMVGASAIAIGTGNFKNDKVTAEVHDGLKQWVKTEGANHIHDLRGSLII